MLAPDILHLRNFYATPFGEAVCAVIAEEIARFWRSAEGDSVLGLGYATPYLSPFLEQKNAVLALMPAAQGAEYWPQNANNLVVLAHDSEMPFAENSINRALLVHSVENSEHLSWMIEETWRVLTPNGKLLAIVPNRRGVWSRSQRSPFGYGRPFSMGQMRDLLAEQNFIVTRTSTALFLPPTYIKSFWKWANKFEKFGRFFYQFFAVFWGGVLLVEAEKQIYSTIPQPVVEARKYRGVLGVARPAMALRKLRKKPNF